MTRDHNCPDCRSSLDRREFIKQAGVAAIASGAAPLLLGGKIVQGAPSVTSAAETAVGRFYQSLSEKQKQTLVLPFDHELRSRISANWHVTKPLLDGDFFNDEQRALVDEIVRNVTSPDGYERLQRQTEDDSGGIGGYSVAVFGTPGAGKFQFELTGRHLTLRADGDSVDKAAFGGPIIYGHSEEDAKKNLFYYQTKAANEVFRALDGPQVAKALIAKAPKEAEVGIQGDGGRFPGIAVAELSADQKKLVESTLKLLLAPYRAEDVDEVFAILKSNGGAEKLHMAFYSEGDLQDDKLWDIWRVEGPAFVWHFRGAPHVHAYINVGMKS